MLFFSNLFTCMSPLLWAMSFLYIINFELRKPAFYLVLFLYHLQISVYLDFKLTVFDLHISYIPKIRIQKWWMRLTDYGNFFMLTMHSFFLNLPLEWNWWDIWSKARTTDRFLPLDQVFLWKNNETCGYIWGFESTDAIF